METELDSTTFFKQNHYWKNTIFETENTLLLFERITPTLDNQSSENIGITTIRPHETVVITNIKTHKNQKNTERWIEIACDENRHGWGKECELLQYMVPDSPLSKIIYYFDKHRQIWTNSILLVAAFTFLHILKRRKKGSIIPILSIKSFYPTALCLTVSLTALVYTTIRHIAPELWAEYYFQPTLNPLHPELSLLLRLLVVMFWSVFLLAIATIDDLIRLADNSNTFLYISYFTIICTTLFIFFNVLVHPWIGFPVWILMFAYTFRKHNRYSEPHFRCGNCHHPLTKDGICDECGAINIIDKKILNKEFHNNREAHTS